VVAVVRSVGIDPHARLRSQWVPFCPSVFGNRLECIFKKPSKAAAAAGLAAPVRHSECQSVAR
jgi:hypothetical protein